MCLGEIPGGAWGGPSLHKSHWPPSLFMCSREERPLLSFTEVSWHLETTATVYRLLHTSLTTPPQNLLFPPVYLYDTDQQWKKQCLSLEVTLWTKNMNSSILKDAPWEAELSGSANFGCHESTSFSQIWTLQLNLCPPSAEPLCDFPFLAIILREKAKSVLGISMERSGGKWMKRPWL